jgi:hypothetical protein
MKEIIKVVLFFAAVLIGLAFLVSLNEEAPHTVVVNGKSYTRSVEYVGNGHYQVIMLPLDSQK